MTKKNKSKAIYSWSGEKKKKETNFKLKNKDFLIKLLETTSYSGEEQPIIDMVIPKLKEYGFTTEVDDIGNIMATRGTASQYPMLNAHMDIVGYGKDSFYDDYKWMEGNIEFAEEELAMEHGQTMFKEELSELFSSCYDCENYSKCPNKDIAGCDSSKCDDFEIDYGRKYIIDTLVSDFKTKSGLSEDEYIELLCQSYGVPNYMVSEKIAYKEPKFVVSEYSNELHGDESRVLGGDDKCGIFVALEIARKTDMPMKILFTVSEEVGCVGVDHIEKHNAQFFDDVKYSITIDRKDVDHLLWSQCGTRSCSNEFASKVAFEGIKSGIPIKIMDGSVSDTIVIRNYTEAVNISAGYFNAHCEDEYIDLVGLKKIIAWVKNIVTNV